MTDIYVVVSLFVGFSVGFLACAAIDSFLIKDSFRRGFENGMMLAFSMDSITGRGRDA